MTAAHVALGLSPMCTVAEYDAATPEQQRAHDEYWLAHWQANAEREFRNEIQRDRDDAVSDREWWEDL
jgi:hypothetical protein